MSDEQPTSGDVIVFLEGRPQTYRVSVNGVSIVELPYPKLNPPSTEINGRVPTWEEIERMIRFKE